MWKESYRIGIDSIDNQHIELFRMTEALLKAIEQNMSSEKYKEAIAFLKDYVVKHFNDEEAYQESINYEGIEEHKAAHREFTAAVLEYEKKLNETNYDVRVVKDLAGTLTAWLIYHVADADQKIANGYPTAVSKERKEYIDSFSNSVSDVLHKMAGLDTSAIVENKINTVKGDVFVKIGLSGDLNGEALFGFSKELAVEFIKILTFIDAEQIDEFVCSALAEFANITCGDVLQELSKNGVLSLAEPPEILNEQTEKLIKGVHIDTGIGGLEMAVQIAK